MSRCRVRTGAVVAVVYAATAGLTTLWSPGAMRPLFDGFGSHPGQYNWVKAPKEFAEGNQRPDSAQAGVTFSAEGSNAAAASTQDGQVLVSLAPGALLPPQPPDSSARIDVRPVDSSTLAPLPDGLRAEGNAYRVSIDYLPSDTPVTSLTRPGTVGLTGVAPPDVLLFSSDGKTWQRRQGQPIAQGNGMTGAFEEAGYYLAAGEGAARATGTGSGGAPLALYLAGAAVPLALGYLLLGRRRKPPARRGGRAAAGGRRPPAAKRPSGTRPPQKRKGSKRKRSKR